MDELTHTQLKYEAIERFRSERQKADRQDLIARLRGKNDDLLPFERLVPILRGYQQIPGRESEMIFLDKIVGSVGRYKDFTRDFRPRSHVLPERWARVYRAMTSLEGVPPIEVFRLGDVYFVADGNHRVSAARASGFDRIAAHVTDIPVDPGLEPGDTLDRAIIKAERTRFLAETHLEERFGEIDELRFTKPGGYQKLLEHIQVHRYFMGLDHPGMGEISFAEAAADWYSQVFQPIVSAVQQRNLLQQFGDSTAADLYVWVSGRILQAAERDGQTISADAAAASLETQGAPVWQRALREIVHALGETAGVLSGAGGDIPEWADLPLEWGDSGPPTTEHFQDYQDE